MSRVDSPPRRVRIPGAGTDLDALIAGEVSLRGVPILMIHENRGLVPYMIDVIESLAAAGHLVVAPDLLSRIGRSASIADRPSVTTRLIDEDTHEADLISVFDWMNAEIGRPAVLGLCFGAEMGWRLITRRSPSRAALLYGIGPSTEAAHRIEIPVYAAYAEHDPRVNDTLPPLCDALVASVADVTMESFPGTRHAFHDHTRPDRYHPACADVVWNRVIAFLDRD